MSFIPYPSSVYYLDYDHVKELSNRIYIQRDEFRKKLDKLHALRTTIKNLSKDTQNLVCDALNPGGSLTTRQPMEYLCLIS